MEFNSADPFKRNFMFDYLKSNDCNQSDSEEPCHEEEDWDTIINKIDDIQENKFHSNSDKSHAIMPSFGDEINTALLI